MSTLATDRRLEDLWEMCKRGAAVSATAVQVEPMEFGLIIAELIALRSWEKNVNDHGSRRSV